jgi:hypothetical protein
LWITESCYFFRQDGEEISPILTNVIPSIEIPLKPAGDSAGSQQVIPEEDSTLLHTENCREFK